MKQRCLNPHSPKYPRYGGRGIGVCERWLDSFANFLADMGRKPSPSHTLERRDGNGNYEPGNCVWATQLEQQNNRCDNRRITYNGETRTMAEWGRHFGMSRRRYRTFRARFVDLGWAFEKAVFAEVPS